MHLLILIFLQDFLQSDNYYFLNLHKELLIYLIIDALFHQFLYSNSIYLSKFQEHDKIFKTYLVRAEAKESDARAVPEPEDSHAMTTNILG